MVSLRASWEAAYAGLDLSKGIVKGGMANYRLLDEPSPTDPRAAFPYRSLRALCEATRWPTSIQHVGDNPRAVESRWTNETNGIVHDDAFWYVVTAKYLFKIPITVPLGEAKGAKVIAPKEQPGWPHGGGCALHKGFLYVAVHEMVAGTIPKGQVWVVDPASLTVVDRFDLDLRMDGDHLVPWVAIHPTKDLLYTMNFSLGTLRIYRLFPFPGEKGPDGKRAVLLGTLTLTDEAGERLSLWHIQSGIITPNNHLLLLSDRAADSFGGLHLFDLMSGVRRWHLSEAAMTTEHSFMTANWKGWEAEVVFLSDWGAHGFIHVLHLDKISANDDVTIKNFDVEPPMLRRLL